MQYNEADGKTCYSVHASDEVTSFRPPSTVDSVPAARRLCLKQVHVTLECGRSSEAHRICTDGGAVANTQQIHTTLRLASKKMR